MKKSFQELVKAIDDFDENWPYGERSMEDYWAERKPLTDALNEWHNHQYQTYKNAS